MGNSELPVYPIAHRPRSGGIHLSDLYHRLYPPKKNDLAEDDLMAFRVLGLALEDRIERALIFMAQEDGEQVERPAEMASPEGIKCSLDLLSIANSVVRVVETKGTWKGTGGLPVDAEGENQFPSKFDIYFCVHPSTQLTTSDLRQVSAEHVRVGDSLLGFDEQPVNGFRHLKHATVEAVQTVLKPCVRLDLSDGTVVVCSEDHQWLGALGSGRQWFRTDNLLRTDQNEGAPRKASVELSRILPGHWGTRLTPHEQGYLAGLFDGEGCLHQLSFGTLKLSMAQKPGRVCSQAEDLLRKDGYAIRKTFQGGVVQLCINEQHEIMRFLATVRPLRLLAKFQGLERIGTLHHAPVQVLQRTSIGVQSVLAIQTSTRTYLAEGLASHNCQIMGYCYVAGTNDARLIAYFVNGNYTDSRKPCLLGWDLSFSNQEIGENWDSLMTIYYDLLERQAEKGQQ